MATKTESRARRPLEAKEYPDAPMEGWTERTRPTSPQTAHVVAATRERLRAAYESRGTPAPMAPADVTADASESVLVEARVDGETVEALLENAKVLAHDEENRGAS